MAAKGPDQSTATFSQNWAIYHLYVRQEYDECLKKIEAQLKLCNGLCEYAVFVKGWSWSPALASHTPNAASCVVVVVVVVVVVLVQFLCSCSCPNECRL